MKIQFTEKGLITFTVVVICGTLLIMGKDHLVGYTLIAVVCGYYGLELGPVQWIIKHRESKNGGK